MHRNKRFSFMPPGITKLLVFSVVLGLFLGMGGPISRAQSGERISGRKARGTRPTREAAGNELPPAGGSFPAENAGKGALQANALEGESWQNYPLFGGR